MTNEILQAILIIVAAINGLFLGNFITTFSYRIPNNLPLSAKELPPFCGSCKQKMQFPDYHPIFYYFFISKFCRFCKCKIPARYAIIEIFTSLACVLCYLKFGLSSQFIAATLLAFCLILNSIIDLTANRLFDQGLWIMVVCFLIFRFVATKQSIDEIMFESMFSIIFMIFTSELTEVAYKKQYSCQRLPYYYYRAIVLSGSLLNIKNSLLFAASFLALLPAIFWLSKKYNRSFFATFYSIIISIITLT